MVSIRLLLLLFVGHLHTSKCVVVLFVWNKCIYSARFCVSNIIQNVMSVCERCTVPQLPTIFCVKKAWKSQAFDYNSTKRTTYTSFSFSSFCVTYRCCMFFFTFQFSSSFLHSTIVVVVFSIVLFCAVINAHSTSLVPSWFEQKKISFSLYSFRCYFHFYRTHLVQTSGLSVQCTIHLFLHILSYSFFLWPIICRSFLY